jgi:signal peptidase II
MSDEIKPESPPVEATAAEPEVIESAEAKAARKAARIRAKWQLFMLVGVLSLVSDQITKIWARASLPTYAIDRTIQTCTIPEDIASQRCGGEAVAVIDSFWHWRLSMNPGSAFGLFSGQGQAGRILLSIVGVLAVVGMVWMLKKSRSDQRVLHWALALVAGGAIGNLIDRIYYGVVTDFALWHWGATTRTGNPNHFQTEWPVFNVADVWLVIGVGLMFIDMQKESKREKAKRKRNQEKRRAAGLVRGN